MFLFDAVDVDVDVEVDVDFEYVVVLAAVVFLCFILLRSVSSSRSQQ